jgi:hypothetical protein
MSKALKWIKFFPADWLGDPGLRTCSAAARGLWIDMICLMVSASPYGHLKLGRKKIDPPTPAGLTNIPPNRIERLLSELHKAGVFSVTNHGTIYSRRMVRESKWRKNGEKAAAARWAHAAETEGKIPKRNGRSNALESKSLRIPRSLMSERVIRDRKRANGSAAGAANGGLPLGGNRHRLPSITQQVRRAMRASLRPIEPLSAKDCRSHEPRQDHTILSEPSADYTDAARHTQH